MTDPADPKAPVAVKHTPTREFWQKASSPTGVSSAVQLFHETRQRDPRAMLFPEAQLNLLGYVHLQAGRTAQAVQLFTLNTLAYPTSANTTTALATRISPTVRTSWRCARRKRRSSCSRETPWTTTRKKAIRDSAEQKIAKMKGGEKK